MKANIVRTGSPWANEKHEAVAIYLRGSVSAAWTSPRKWSLVDAVSAGPRCVASELAATMPRMQTHETTTFVEGLREVALDTLPSFPRYYLLEPGGSTPAYHAAAAGNGRLLDGPAALGQLVSTSWTERRSLMFVDPLAFGIGWQTIAAIAATQAIDLWLWFPVGIGADAWAARPALLPGRWSGHVDRYLGSTDWRVALERMNGAAASDVALQRAQRLGELLLARLGSVFGQVAPRAVVLRDSAGEPLYVCCFAGATDSDMIQKFRFVNTFLKRLAA